jgi:hypothetical protein
MKKNIGKLMEKPLKTAQTRKNRAILPRERGASAIEAVKSRRRGLTTNKREAKRGQQ